MSVTKRSYCIFGCDDLGAYMHRFPHPVRKSELFAKWVEIAGNKLNLPDPMKVYKSKRICDFHFKTEHKAASHRLIHMAVPTLYLNGIFSSSVLSVQQEHNYCIPRMYENSLNLEHIDGTTSANTVTVQRSDEDIQAHLLSQPSTSQMSQNKSSQNTSIKKYISAKNEIRRLKKQIVKAEKKEKNYKTRLENAQKMLKENTFDKITKNMSKSGKLFTAMQYRQALKKPKGRRFTTEEKILALTIFKKSPKCYSLLYKYFSLPSSKSLRSLLSEIKIEPGVNKVIFEKIKDTVSDFAKEDCLCSLIFDEMSLTPNLDYCASSDEIKGFVSHKEETKIANHALVFMIKGLKKNFKQPIAYYFTNSLNMMELKCIIQEIIKHVHLSGLRVLCTVCDQGAVNVGAINSLVEDTKAKYLKQGKEWREEKFEVNGQTIIPLYDVPHLLKGLRNNLLTKDLQYNDSNDANKTKIVKWKYFQMLYEADKSYGELRYLHKLTEEHINPEKIKKMRVKMAAQIFSHSVAVATEHLTARGNLPEECRQLIPAVLLLDKLFDSLNAGTFNIQNGKIYRAGIKKRSPHHKLWQEGIAFLKGCKFIARKKIGDKIRLVETSTPSIKNFIKTIEGMQALWKILNQKYSLDTVLTRNFNQDPVENFFGNIRSLGARNTSPSCRAFESAFKTTLLNNYSSPHAVNANCEEDFDQCLQNLDFLIKERKATTEKGTNVESHPEIELDEKILELLSTGKDSNPSEHQQRRYVCGWVLSKCLSKIVKSCKVCRQRIIATNNSEGNEYIQAKEYHRKKQWLCYPSDELSNCFNEVQDITTAFIQTNLKNRGTKENIKLLADAFVAFPFNCDLHKEKLKEYFLDITINILMYSWCRSINRILSGKITYTEGTDPTKQTAQIYYNKHKHRKF